MLQSALTSANDTVRRVVITSSCSAVLTEDPDLTTSRTFSEADWNEAAIQDVKDHGRDASQIDKYHASKALAERAAWTFAKEHEGKASFDVVAINPPYVYGPWLHDVKRPEDLNTSTAEFYKAVIKGAKTAEELATEG